MIFIGAHGAHRGKGTMSNTMTNNWDELMVAAAKGDDTPVWNEQGNRLEGDYEITPLERLAFSAVHDLASVTKDLLQASAAIVRDMEGVQRSIANGYSVNSLGELQSRGSRLDQLCALREAKAQHARALINTLTRD